MQHRPYQSEALRVIPAKLREGINRQLAKWPTGTGKTVLFSSLPDALNMQGRMLVLVHREELAKQAKDKIQRWNPNRTVGIEMAENRAGNSQIVVASVQTLGSKGNKRILQYDPADFEAVVIDEAHHATASTYRNIVEYFRLYTDKERLLLGVTATPNRADGEGLGKVFEEIVHDISILDAINQGWLSNIRGLQFRTQTMLDGVRSLAGEFNLGDLGKTVNTPARNDLIARSWIEQGQNRQAVAFTTDIDHAQMLAAAFKRYGVSAEAIWGEDPARDDKLKLHQRGHIKVICNCQILTEGYDDWRVGCIILARPTKSEGLYTQMIGRGTRIPDNISNLIEARAQGLPILKEDCLVMDFVDVSGKHSLVTLPTLFGLSHKLDIRGKTVTELDAEIQAIKKRKPFVDLSAIEDINKLKVDAEKVDLFKVQYAPEIIKFSEYQWHKTGPSAYVLTLRRGDYVVVQTDVLGRWFASGMCEGSDIFMQHTTLEDAINWADKRVRTLGGSKLTSCISRKASWHDLPPKPAQLDLARKLRIPIPLGMTRGDLSAKLNEALALRKQSPSGLEAIVKRIQGI